MTNVVVSRKELSRFYNTMSVAQVCEHYGISKPTLYALLEKAQIPKKLLRSKTVRPILVD